MTYEKVKPKLTAPTIRLESVEDETPTLEAPRIELYEHSCAAPTNLRTNNNNLVWDGSESVDWYKIKAIDENGNETTATESDYDKSQNPHTDITKLATTVGTYTFEVKGCATPDDENGAVSKITLEILPAPQNVYLDGDILRWDAVEGASGYTAYGLRGSMLFSMPTEETYHDWSPLKIFDEETIITLYVRANGYGLASDTVDFNAQKPKLEAPSIYIE